jgi:hypothetical protein
MLGMALDAERQHIEQMIKSPLQMLRIAENDWQIAAERPGTETQHIKGLNSKSDVEVAGGHSPHSLVSRAGLREMTSAWSGTWVTKVSCPYEGECYPDDQQFARLAGRAGYQCACNNAWRLRSWVIEPARGYAPWQFTIGRLREK